MDLKKILLLFISFSIGFASGIAFKIVYESSTYRPYEWDKEAPPVIVNCYGKDFNKLQMVRAIEYWTLRGEIISKYVHEPSGNVCDHDWLEGYIIVRKETSTKNPSTLASTKRYTSLARIKGAVIRYKPNTSNINLINEHELGHALGYTHVEIDGHIMHPLYHKMGRDFWIPVK